jgi:hypothetical protein
LEFEMPFVLLIVGIALLVAGVRNTQGDLFTLVQGDFIGQNNFIFWFVAIFLIGSLGYIEKLKPLSTAFMGLVILVMFLAKGKGFFPQFTSALNATQSAQPATSASATAATGGGLGPLPGLPSLGTLLTNSGVTIQ